MRQNGSAVDVCHFYIINIEVADWTEKNDLRLPSEGAGPVPARLHVRANVAGMMVNACALMGHRADTKATCRRPEVGNVKVTIILNLIAFRTGFAQKTNALEWAKRLHVAVFSYPLSKHNIGRRVFTWGLFFQDYLSKSGLICDVADGGWADKNGIHQGSTFKKAVGINRYWKNYSPGNGKEPKENIFNEHQNKKILFDNKNISSPSQEDFECHYFFIPESVAE